MKEKDSSAQFQVSDSCHGGNKKKQSKDVWKMKTGVDVWNPYLSPSTMRGLDRLSLTLRIIQGHLTAELQFLLQHKKK